MQLEDLKTLFYDLIY